MAKDAPKSAAIDNDNATNPNFLVLCFNFVSPFRTCYTVLSVPFSLFSYSAPPLANARRRLQGAHSHYSFAGFPAVRSAFALRLFFGLFGNGNSFTFCLIILEDFAVVGVEFFFQFIRQHTVGLHQGLVIAYQKFRVRLCAVLCVGRHFVEGVHIFYLHKLLRNRAERRITLSAVLYNRALIHTNATVKRQE